MYTWRDAVVNALDSIDLRNSSTSGPVRPTTWMGDCLLTRQTFSVGMYRTA